MAGPLGALHIIELAGVGPGPFAAMMLADHGAEVIRIDRIGGGGAGPESPPETDILLRSRRRMELDLKSDVGRAVLQELVATADGLIEGFRPGVMERLALGPDALLAINPRLVYGRMTGWGQHGPLAQTAGHDINYIALSGALHAFGRAGEAPVPPANMVGDFGGGAMMLAFGMLAALIHARDTGEGQVVDAAMTDGSALLMAMIHTFIAQGTWRDERGVNLLDTGAHFYNVYETADGKHVALGPIEPQFYARFLSLAGLEGDSDFAGQMNPARWAGLTDRLRALFLTRTRDDWNSVFESSDACYTPVLSQREAQHHPHNIARGTFVRSGGVTQPAPAPRYSISQTVPPQMYRGQTDTAAILRDLGHDDAAIAALLASGGVR